MFHRFTERFSQKKDLSPPTKMAPRLAASAEALLHLERKMPEDAPVEKLVIGGERLDELLQAVWLAERPEPDTFFTVPKDIEKMVVAQTVLPEDLPEGAPVERWSVALPVDAFVDAPNFVDWHKGRADLKNGKRSEEVINKYARMPSETAAPIQHVMVYMQPDGKVFCGLTGDGAHRLAAAKKRDDEAIRARDVVFAKLLDNLL